MSRITPPSDPWDRLRDESHRAWKAFVIYRDAGPGRSVKAVPEQMAGLGIDGITPRTVYAWASSFSWVARAGAWDAEQDRLDQIWMQDERRKAIKRHVRQAQALANLWLQRLQSLNPDELSPSDLIRFAEVTTRLEREALKISATADGGVTVNMVGSVSALTSVDVEVRLKELQLEVQRRLNEATRSAAAAALPAYPGFDDDDDDDVAGDGDDVADVVDDLDEEDEEDEEDPDDDGPFAYT